MLKSNLGGDWLANEVDGMDDFIERIDPVSYNEAYRYLAQGTRRPGFIRYDLFPFLREPIMCFDIASDVREVNFMKGVQVGFTTFLESVLFYYICQVKTQSGMFLTADKEMADDRMNKDIMPMLFHSDKTHLIKSPDESNTRKTGQNARMLQWEGGGSLISAGANNTNKMRSHPISFMLKDEIDGWKRLVGKDGNPDLLTDDRLSTFWESRKILRGSTPSETPSMINEAYLRGDQRKYMILCKSCSFPQFLRQESINKESGVIGGFQWDLQDDKLINESVRYCCQNCGHEHYEGDKERIFSEESGAHWLPTAEPISAGIRSYHLPGFYSPFGFTPWYKHIGDYLSSYDPVKKETLNVGALQKYYNNTLGVPFKKLDGAGVKLEKASAHRREIYKYGEIPNEYAAEYSGSKILFLTCQVDVHKRNLAVSVMGWTRDSRCYLIDYWRFDRKNDDDDCANRDSPVWEQLSELIYNKRYQSKDGIEYMIAMTFVDSGWSNDTVTGFCGEFGSNVHAIVGRQRAAKNQRINEFREFKTQAGVVGYAITVDHYKDRIASVLHRNWDEQRGEQRPHHFNAPVDMTQDQMKEFSAEERRAKTDDRGNEYQVWHRKGGADNEIFDLLCYGYCAVEVIAWKICIQYFELDDVNWEQFWDFAEKEENNEMFARLAIL